MNEELIHSAVSFLQDSNVASSPISKKVEFLQSKGLNEEEIEEAIRRAGQSSTSSSSVQPAPKTYAAATNSQNQNQAPLDYYAMAPPAPDRTWKDYFIMATATAGVTYGLYQVVTRYLLPSIVPPGQSRVDEDKQRMEEEFVKIDKVLEQMTQEQQEIKETNKAKLADIDTAIGEISGFVAKYNKEKERFDDELRLMKLEVDNLQNTVEKNLKLTKDNIHDELSGISEELASLQNLIKSRNSNGGSAERKVKPVSSIPSASEILKKVNSGNSEATQAPRPGPEPTLKGAVSKGNVTAAGIPDWMMADKKREEEEEKKKAAEWEAAEKQAAAERAADKEKSGIPSWQQAAQENGAAKDDSAVKQSIQNVGVPSWQLNAS